MSTHVRLDAPSHHLVCLHCGAMSALGLPVDLGTMATRMRDFEAAHARCPRPTTPPVVKPPRPAPATTTTALFAWPGLAAWLDEGDRGLSSEAIVAAITGIVLNDDNTASPWDAGDFRRCTALLHRVPALVPHLDRVAAINATWAEIVARWSHLSELGAMAGSNDLAWEQLTDELQEIHRRTETVAGWP